MADSGDGRLLALLGLRLKGFASAEGVAEVIGVEADAVASALVGAVEDGLVNFHEAREVYLLNPSAGRPEGERLLAEQLDAAGVRGDVQAAYDDFLGLNQSMLQLCTDWQIRADGDPDVHIEGKTLNDHSDEDYDQDVLSRLVELDADLRKILTKLRSLLVRYGSYVPRFRTALDKLLAGELEYFTKPIIASYHTVWFELHEDLLATLGIDRATEGST
jgi:hypothetical protein